MILMTVRDESEDQETKAQLHVRKKKRREWEDISAALTVFNTVRHEQLMRWNGTVWID